jgi:sporulation protein YlmC with PRC-barrel domain
MQFKEGAHVFTPDGTDVGQISHIVFNPSSKEATHVVVRQGWLFSEDRVIPIRLFGESNAERATLHARAEDFERFPEYKETHFIPAEVLETEGGYVKADGVRPVYAYPPLTSLGFYGPYGYGIGSAPVVPQDRVVETTAYNIPEDAVALQKGADVYSLNNDLVGQVESMMIDDETNRVSHVIISQGLMLKTRKLVPATWFANVAEDDLRLAVSTSLLDSLPDYAD